MLEAREAEDSHTLRIIYLCLRREGFCAAMVNWRIGILDIFGVEESVAGRNHCLTHEGAVESRHLLI